MCCKKGLKIISNLNKTGMEACNGGRLVEAEANLRAALDEVRMLGSKCYEAKILNNLGIVYEVWGCADAARSHYEEAMKLVEEKIGRNNRLYEILMTAVGRVEAKCGEGECALQSGKDEISLSASV